MSFKLHLILDVIFPTFHTSVKRRKITFNSLMNAGVNILQFRKSHICRRSEDRFKSKITSK